MATVLEANTSLLTLAKAESKAYADWQDSDDDVPSSAYWEVLDELLNYSGHVPSYVAHPYKDLEDSYDEFNSTGSAMPSRKMLVARGEFHAAINREPPKLEDPPSIQELVSKDVSHVQAARIWKLFAEDGRPMTELVQLELDKPGSVITKEHIAQHRRIRLAEAGFGAPPAVVIRETKLPKHDSQQSIEQMVSERVPVEQIVTVKVGQYGGKEETRGQWTEVVRMIAILTGTPVPNTGAEVLNKSFQDEVAKKEGRRSLDRPTNVFPVLKPTEIKSGSDETGIETNDHEPTELQIVELFDAGHDEKTIAKHFNLTIKKVKAVIAAADAEAEAGEDV
jgi:hypothetical protein